MARITAMCCAIIFVGCTSMSFCNVYRSAIDGGREYVRALPLLKPKHSKPPELVDELFRFVCMPPEFMQERIIEEVSLGPWVKIECVPIEWRSLYICATADEINDIRTLVEHYDVDQHRRCFILQHANSVDSLLKKLNEACQKYIYNIKYDDKNQEVYVWTSCRIMPEVARLVEEHNIQHSRQNR